MIIDRNRVLDVFANYTAGYDDSNPKIRLKIEHTYRVAKFAESIAKSLLLNDEDVDFAWLCGMLHDIGRFEQLRRFNTFTDKDSIDHAEFGADLLFGRDEASAHEMMIRKFLDDKACDRLIDDVVRTHSSYRLPESFDERTLMFCNILRDADKIDILRVNIDFPLTEIYNVEEDVLYNSAVTKEVLDAFYEHHAVLRNLKKTPADNVVAHIALVYELVYPYSIEQVKMQGYLDQMLLFDSNNEETKQVFEHITEEINAFMEQKLLEV